MTPDQKYDLLRLLIQVGIPIIGVLLAGFGGAIVGAFLTGYLRYRENLDSYRINFVNTLQAAIRDSLMTIGIFLELGKEDKLLKEPLVRSSLINLKQKVTSYISNGLSIETMITRKGNRLLYGSILNLELQMRNYDELLTNAELTKVGLEGVRTLLLKITSNYKKANYSPDSFYIYASRLIRSSFRKVK
jgi:hypothetical protein